MAVQGGLLAAQITFGVATTIVEQCTDKPDVLGALKNLQSETTSLATVVTKLAKQLSSTENLVRQKILSDINLEVGELATNLALDERMVTDTKKIVNKLVYLAGGGIILLRKVFSGYNLLLDREVNFSEGKAAMFDFNLPKPKNFVDLDDLRSFIAMHDDLVKHMDRMLVKPWGSFFKLLEKDCTNPKHCAGLRQRREILTLCFSQHMQLQQAELCEYRRSKEKQAPAKRTNDVDILIDIHDHDANGTSTLVTDARWKQLKRTDNLSDYWASDSLAFWSSKKLPRGVVLLGRRVTELDLYRCRLTGACIWHFVVPVVLARVYSRVFSALPESISQLSNLKNLYCQRNMLSGRIYF
jgi:hypothetical protein